MDVMRSYVGDVFAAMLKKSNVDAKIKTGILGCEVSTPPFMTYNHKL
jgi:hypothetical protein